MNLIEPLRFAVLGLGAGGIFGLIALGLVITYRGSGVINFAQGAIAMTGAFTFYFLVHERHWAFLPALVGGVLVSSLVGTAFAYLVLRRLRHAAAVTRLIATLTLLVVLQEGVSLQFGNDVIVLRPALHRGVDCIGPHHRCGQSNHLPHFGGGNGRALVHLSIHEVRDSYSCDGRESASLPGARLFA